MATDVKAYYREYARKRREAGLCVTCGLSLDRCGFRRCDICREKTRAFAAERRAQNSKPKKTTKIDLAHKRFGRLLVVKEDGRMWRNVAWMCLCDCGKYTTVPGQSLRTGRTQSCGCLQREYARRTQIKKMNAVDAVGFFERREGDE